MTDFSPSDESADIDSQSLSTRSRPPLYLAGKQVDARGALAIRFRRIAEDFTSQLHAAPTPAQRLQCQQAATLALLCERDTAALLRGEDIEQEPLRRNIALMRTLLVSLGQSKQIRDTRKADAAGRDEFADALADVAGEKT